MERASSKPPDAGRLGLPAAVLLALASRLAGLAEPCEGEGAEARLAWASARSTCCSRSSTAWSSMSMGTMVSRCGPSTIPRTSAASARRCCSSRRASAGTLPAEVVEGLREQLARASTAWPGLCEAYAYRMRPGSATRELVVRVTAGQTVVPLLFHPDGRIRYAV